MELLAMICQIYYQLHASLGELEDALGPDGGEGEDPEWYLRPINLVKNQSVESIDDDKRLLNNKNTRGWPNSYWSQLYK